MLLIALHAKETDLGGRQHAGHAIEHAQAGAQHRHDDRTRMVGQLLADHRADRRFDRAVHNIDVAGGLVGLEHDQLGDEFAERGGRGVLVTQDGELVFHQRVVQNMNFHTY